VRTQFLWGNVLENNLEDRERNRGIKIDLRELDFEGGRCTKVAGIVSHGRLQLAVWNMGMLLLQLAVWNMGTLRLQLAVWNVGMLLLQCYLML
jgi:hypothetical protein